jgi:hypothetical protein
MSRPTGTCNWRHDRCRTRDHVVTCEKPQASACHDLIRDATSGRRSRDTGALHRTRIGSSACDLHLDVSNVLGFCGKPSI